VNAPESWTKVAISKGGNVSNADAPALRPIPFRVLIDQAMALTRRHFKAIYPLAAALFTAGAALTVGAQMRMFSHIGPAGAMAKEFQFQSVISFLVFMFVVYLATYGLGTVAVGVLAVDATAGRAVRVGSRLLAVFHPRFWGTLLLAGALTVLAMLFCFFPAIYVGLLFFLVIPVMVEEEKFGPAALGRSKDLIRFNPQRHFVNAPMVKAGVIALVIWLLSLTAGAVVQVPFAVVKQVLIIRRVLAHGAGAGASFSPFIPWLDLPAALFGALIAAAIQLYGSFAIALFFFDVRSRKEGADLEGVLAEIEAAGSPPARVQAPPAAPASPPETPPEQM
jgi:hypothetical protein